MNETLRVVADDDAHQIEAYRAFIERMAQAINRRLGPGHPATAEDLAQEGAIAVVEARRLGLKADEFERAVRARIRWRMLDCVHRASLISRRAYRWGARAVPLGEWEPSMDGTQTLSLEAAQAWRSMRALDPRTVYLLRLLYEQETPQGAIARQLAISEGRVVQLRTAALERLRGLMDDAPKGTLRITEHVSLEAFLFSQTAARAGHRLNPSEKVIANLSRLRALVLEPLRRRYGPVFVTSGYRDAWLNQRVGGAPNSAHKTGRAADILVAGLGVRDCCLKMLDMELPFDKCIDKFGEWCHVEVAEPGKVPRCELWRARRGKRGVRYKEGLA